MQKHENKGVVGGATVEVVENKGAKMTGTVHKGGRRSCVPLDAPFEPQDKRGEPFGAQGKPKWEEYPHTPAVLRKSADVVDAKGIAKHSLTKEREERTRVRNRT
jgi:hypothetical protein